MLVRAWSMAACLSFQKTGKKRSCSFLWWFVCLREGKEKCDVSRDEYIGKETGTYRKYTSGKSSRERGAELTDRRAHPYTKGFETIRRPGSTSFLL